MSPELTTYVREIAEAVAVTDRLFRQSEATVTEPEIHSCTKTMRILTENLQQFAADKRPLAAKRLGAALEVIRQSRDAAERRWNDERQE